MMNRPNHDIWTEIFTEKLPYSEYGRLFAGDKDKSVVSIEGKQFGAKCDRKYHPQTSLNSNKSMFREMGTKKFSDAAGAYFYMEQEAGV